MPRKNNNSKKRNGNKSPQPSSPSQQLKLLNPSNLPELPQQPSLGGIYARYKQATNSFKDGLALSGYSGRLDTVQSFMEAADELAAASQNVPRRLLRDLRTAIDIRTRVMNEFYQGGDDTHTYFVEVLEYCWSVLLPCVKEEQKKTRDEKQDHVLENCFEVLLVSLDNYDKKDGDDEKTQEGPAQKRRTIKKPAVRPALTLEDLIHGSDTFQASIFLMELDEKMGMITSCYRQLAQQQDHILPRLMQAAALCNHIIQHVLFLEQQLAASFPYLESVVSVFALLFAPAAVQRVSLTVRKHSKYRTKFDKAHAIEFVGTIIQASLNDDRTDAAVDEFLEHWHVERTQLDADLIQSILTLVQQDIPDDFGTGDKTTAKRHEWLRNFSNLGAHDRYMLQTMRSLQRVFRSPRPTTPNGQQQSYSDLALRFLKRSGMLMLIQPPNADRLLTVMNVVQNHVTSATDLTVITWPVLFAMQVYTTALLELNPRNLPDNRFACRVSDAAQAYWQNFAASFHHVQSENVFTQQSQEQRNRMRLRLVSSMISDLSSSSSSSRYPKPFWDPLLAGEYVLYLGYFLNGPLGLLDVDAHLQARFVLHLFNALRAVGFLNCGDVPFMDWVDDLLTPSRVIWGGPKPNKGDFVKRFLVSYGLRTDTAQMEAAFVQLENTGKKTNRRHLSRAQAKMEFHQREKSVIVDPAQFSKGYRLIFEKGYSAVVDSRDDHSLPMYYQQRQQQENSQAQEVLKIFIDEQEFLAADFLKIGIALDDFLTFLFGLPPWKQKMDEILQKLPPRLKFSESNQTETRMIQMTQGMLGPLDYYKGIDDKNTEVLKRTADSFRIFFRRLMITDYQFFCPSSYSEN